MLHYTTYKHKSSKEWVTFIHGAGGSSSIWFKQIRSFTKEFNVLILDLRGHGNSKPKLYDTSNVKYTFDTITNDIVDVLNHAQIKTSHFVGISLVTILIRNLAEKYPEKVKSMILGGAIMKLNMRSQLLMRLGNFFKSVVPYMYLYKFFAFVIMPKKNHKSSRLLFVNEAKKLCQKEFIRWFKLTSEINSLLMFFRSTDIKIPTLYIMGKEDHLFLPEIKNLIIDQDYSSLFIIEHCGHVVNVEQPALFNATSIKYIKSHYT